jgi:hypothetical protein
MTSADSSQPTGLAVVQRVRVQRSVVESVHNELRDAGRRNCEGVGFWAGTLVGAEFFVTASYVPKQFAGELEGGSLVMVDGDQLFQMNVWLHSNRLTLIAQVHSHPSEAYHSKTDDDFPIMARVGGLSIVVPDYAAAPFSLTTAAFYRLQRHGHWHELSLHEVAALIEIIK